MTNREVFRAFAANKQGEAHHVKSRRTETGVLVLYSYTTPIAYRDGEAAVFDERKYSVTTGKQMTQAKAEFAAYDVQTAPHDAFRAALRFAEADLGMAR